MLAKSRDWEVGAGERSLNKVHQSKLALAKRELVLAEHKPLALVEHWITTADIRPASSTSLRPEYLSLRYQLAVRKNCLRSTWNK